MKRNLLFVTGTRADYGKLKPLAKIAQSLGHNVSFYVTGMHVLKRYGLTKIEIIRDGYDSVDEYINQKPNDVQSTIIAKTITSFTDFLMENSPDLVVIHGDRVEALACAIAASSNYFNLLHIEGGEISGTIDEVYRHAITKLANLHIVSSEVAKKRLVRMGENPERVFDLGSPELMIHDQTQQTDIDKVKQHYNIAFDEFGIAIFHPVTSERKTISLQARLLFKELKKSRKNFVVISPNNDPGCDDIVKEIDKLPDDSFYVIPSMRFEFFSVLLKNAGIIVGNSSAGVREAPYLGIPSINFGSRQNNRSSSESIFNVSLEQLGSINEIISKEWYSRYEKSCEFGDGGFREKFLSLLNGDLLWARANQKYYYE